jgi:DNA-binding NarL/FixJ family response regulator
MICLLKEVEVISSIHTAHNYDETFALLDKKPDLILLDIHLPERNGMDILKRVKKSARDCEVIMLSNYAGEYYKEQCRKLGALFFLDKTNEFELVPARIKEIALQHDRRDDYREKTAA